MHFYCLKHGAYYLDQTLPIHCFAGFGICSCFLHEVCLLRSIARIFILLIILFISVLQIFSILSGLDKALFTTDAVHTLHPYLHFLIHQLDFGIEALPDFHLIQKQTFPTKIAYDDAPSRPLHQFIHSSMPPLSILCSHLLSQKLSQIFNNERFDGIASLPNWS